MTERLSALALSSEGATVLVEPRVVVEVLFTDLQRSPMCPSGLALRFARIARIRDDTTPAEADTLQHLQTLFERQQARGRSGA
jgi:DNA ligase-1